MNQNKLIDFENEIKQLELINDDFEFCRVILPKVSRTFAINISFLNGELYTSILCSYLFCRILDTIEDSYILTVSEKTRFFEIWNEIFPLKNYSDEKLEQLLSFYSKGRNHDDNPFETYLLKHSRRVFKVFHKLDRKIIEVITPWILEMSKGMKKIQEEFSDKTFKCLKNTKHLEEYCYYVAGTVGEFLKELFFISCPDLSAKSKKIMTEYAVSFGLGLQITNIIKDFRDDKKREWCFVPEELIKKEGLSPEDFFSKSNDIQASRILKELINLASKHLDDALEFSLQLPRFRKDLRLFCFLPLHFAIETLKVAKMWADSPSENKIKISRKSVKRTMLYTNISYFSNFLQTSFYNHFRKHL